MPEKPLKNFYLLEIPGDPNPKHQQNPFLTQVAGAKPLMNFGFHAGPTIETQILLPPTSVYYLPLPRFPMNDGCAFQQGASPASGCELTGVPFTEHPAGGFTFGRPFSNTSHCQVCPHASLSHILHTNTNININKQTNKQTKTHIHIRIHLHTLSRSRSLSISLSLSHTISSYFRRACEQFNEHGLNPRAPFCSSSPPAFQKRSGRLIRGTGLIQAPRGSGVLSWADATNQLQEVRTLILPRH